MQTFEMYFVHEQLALIMYIFIVLKFFVSYFFHHFLTFNTCNTFKYMIALAPLYCFILFWLSCCLPY